MELVGVTVVMGHRGAVDGGGGGVLMLLMVPRSLALRQQGPLCRADLCGQRSLCSVRQAVLVQGRGAAVCRWRWALGRVLLAVCSGALGMGWCDAAWPESRLENRALLAGALRRRSVGPAPAIVRPLPPIPDFSTLFPVTRIVLDLTNDYMPYETQNPKFLQVPLVTPDHRIQTNPVGTPVGIPCNKIRTLDQ